MKVGDYVRTDEGEIGKLKELKLDYTKGKRLVTYYTYREVEENFIIFDNKNITQRFVDGSCYYLTDDELKNVEESIIKSSPNIIDLIEVGDFIGNYVVEQVYNYEDGTKTLFLSNGFDEVDDKYILENGVVTKEQFNSMEYKIGDK